MEKLISVQLLDPTLPTSLVALRFEGPTVARNVWMTQKDYLAMMTECLKFTGQDLLAAIEQQQAVGAGA